MLVGNFDSRRCQLRRHLEVSQQQRRGKTGLRTWANMIGSDIEAEFIKKVLAAGGSVAARRTGPTTSARDMLCCTNRRVALSPLSTTERILVNLLAAPFNAWLMHATTARHDFSRKPMKKSRVVQPVVDVLDRASIMAACERALVHTGRSGRCLHYCVW